MEEFTAQGNTNFKPVFNVKKWITLETLDQFADPDFDPLTLFDGSSDSSDAPAPKPRRRL